MLGSYPGSNENFVLVNDGAIELVELAGFGIDKVAVIFRATAILHLDSAFSAWEVNIIPQLPNPSISP